MNPLDTILQASADYYNGSPTMSDTEYDALVASFAKKLPMFYDQWRASFIGPKPAHATAHPFKMLSLRGNGFDHFAEFAEWLATMPKKEKEFLVQPKIDGHAVAITYTASRLTRVATRGDGASGKDITGLVLKNKILPAKLPGRVSKLTLSGELYIPLENWNSAEFSHPRNELCSVMNGLSSPRRSVIRALVHGVHLWTGENFARKESEVFAYLAGRLGLPVVQSFTLEPRVLVQRFGETLHAYLDHFRKTLPVDGLVVKIDDFASRRRVGESAVAPLWAYALKEYTQY
jgi:NAD-dependent DNA ligase